MSDQDYWDNTKARILDDIEKISSVIMTTNGLWMGNQDETFQALLSESNRVNGAIHGFLIRQLLECEYFRYNPPPNPNQLHKREPT